MKRLTKSAGVVAIGIVVAALSWGQSKSERNTIEGVVVWKQDSLNKSVAHPIEDAFAVAYDSTNKLISRSEPTGSDGKFSLVVPDSVKEFRLLIHQKQVRFWDYNPNDPVSNRGHPHDLGEIVLDDKHELSKGEADAQAMAALLLYKLHETSATLLLDRAAKAYLVHEAGSGNCLPVPMELQVSYRDPRSRLHGVSSLGAEMIEGELIMNAKKAFESMLAVLAKQERFFKRRGFYATLDQMVDSERMRRADFEPPGYCIDLVSGILNGKSFVADDTPRPNYYVLFAVPNPPGKAGVVYLYADPTGIIRYSEWRQGIKRNLQEALPVEPGFPLGIGGFARPSR